MSYSRYLQAITKGLHDYVLPQLENGQARDVLTNGLRALASIAENLDRQPTELLAAIDTASLPPELAAITAEKMQVGRGLRLATQAPVDDFAMGDGSFPLIESGARWLASTSWLGSASSFATAKSLLRWEHGLRTQAMQRVGNVERGQIAGAGASADVANIDQAALQGYLRRRLDNDALEVSEFRFLTGGRVRQTALFSLTGHPGMPEKQVVQRDNPAGITSFKGPAMQFALLERLHQAGMRVPRPLLVESSADALGGAFLIAERLPGSSPVPAMDYFSPPPQSERLARSLAQQVAVLHTTAVGELAAVMSSSLEPEQNPSWASDTLKMEAAWNANAHAPSMAITAAFAWMRAKAGTVEDRRCLVHSDLLLHNILADGEEVSAVLDWEAAHIGHPAEDLGYLRPVVERMTDWRHFLDAYTAAGGRCPSAIEIDFFTLRALTTLSVWVQYARGAFESGRTADSTMAEVGAAFLPKLVNRLAEQMVAILERN